MLLETGGGGRGPDADKKPKKGQGRGPKPGGGSSDGASHNPIDAFLGLVSSQQSSSPSASKPRDLTPQIASVIEGGSSGTGSATSTAADRQGKSWLQPYAAVLPTAEPDTTGLTTPRYDLSNDPRVNAPEHKTLEEAFRQRGSYGAPDATPREQALAAPEVKKYKVRKTREMTWEEYNALSNSERAAVDFNTMLVQAREKDLKTDYDETKKEVTNFTTEVEKMFGEEGGTTTFAPETLAMLQSIKFDGRGQDFDDFLGLKVAIGEKALRNLPVPAGPLASKADTVIDSFIGNPVQELQSQLIEKTAALQAEMAKSGELLANWQKSSMEARNDLVKLLGGDLNEVKPGLGFGPPPIHGDGNNIHTFFQSSFNALTLRENEGQALNEVLGILNEQLDEGEKKAFLRYADDLTRYSEQYGLKFGKDSKRRSAAEIRQLLNIDHGGE